MSCLREVVYYAGNRRKKKGKKRGVETRQTRASGLRVPTVPGRLPRLLAYFPWLFFQLVLQPSKSAAVVAT